MKALAKELNLLQVKKWCFREMNMMHMGHEVALLLVSRMERVGVWDEVLLLPLDQLPQVCYVVYCFIYLCILVTAVKTRQLPQRYFLP